MLIISLILLHIHLPSNLLGPPTNLILPSKYLCLFSSFCTKAALRARSVSFKSLLKTPTVRITNNINTIDFIISFMNPILLSPLIVKKTGEYIILISTKLILINKSVLHNDQLYCTRNIFMFRFKGRWTRLI